MGVKQIGAHRHGHCRKGEVKILPFPYLDLRRRALSIQFCSVRNLVDRHTSHIAKTENVLGITIRHGCKTVASHDVHACRVCRLHLCPGPLRILIRVSGTLNPESCL